MSTEPARPPGAVHITEESGRLVGHLVDPGRQVVRLNQLLGDAQLARDRAQAQVAAVRALAEEWRGSGSVPVAILDRALDRAAVGDP